MTRQLDEARRETERHRQELEAARAYLESILANLSAGVLVFDRRFVLRLHNDGAGTILTEDFSGLLGELLEAWPRQASFARALRDGFAESPGAAWQGQVELARDQRFGAIKADVPLGHTRFAMGEPTEVIETPFMSARFSYDVPLPATDLLEEGEKYTLLLRMLNADGLPVSDMNGRDRFVAFRRDFVAIRCELPHHPVRVLVIAAAGDQQKKGDCTCDVFHHASPLTLSTR